MKTSPQEHVLMIVNSHVPLGEDEEAFYSVKQKVDHGQALSESEELLLERLAGKAKKWEEGVRSSAATEPEYTLGG